MAIVNLSDLLELVGKLDDSEGENTARERFRRHLKAKITKIEYLREYIEECLRNSGSQYKRAFQDLVNHLGYFLGFEVTYGCYQGERGESGFDGYWNSATENCHIIIEVNASEIYPINTSTLIGYVEKMIANGQIPNWEVASGLYVSSASDRDGQVFENQLVAENRTHQLRLVFVESLLSLAEMRQQSILSHEDILLFLRPATPRIDPTIELIKRLVSRHSSDLEIDSTFEEKLIETGTVERSQKKRFRRVRLRRGDATPPKAFYLPILQALDELGGSAKVSDVLARVEQLMQGILKDIDYERIPHQKNKPRWRMNCYNARFAMVRNKLLKERSEEGVWEINSAGRQYLEQESNEPL